jgi:hypothetical protein
MTRILISRRLRLVASAVLLPALMLRALVPAGFMPASGAGAVIAMQMCSAVNPGAMIFLRLDSESRLRVLGTGDQTAPGQHDERGTACEFALASFGTAPPPASTAVVLATLDRERRPHAMPDRAPIASLPEHTQQPRAPPRHS